VIAGVIETVNARYEEELPDQVAGLLAAARSSSHRMQHLIADLLAYSRAGHGVELAPLELGDLALEQQITETRAGVEVGELPRVLGDARQLRLVFGNLIGNAIKYRRPRTPPRIEITAEPHGEGWTICVADNGIGIDPARAEAVFDMFERERPDDGDKPGSGIGLALCKRIVERHDGEIWIEPRPEGGTVVCLTLRSSDPHG
jgi:signal transduction histidine kinase